MKPQWLKKIFFVFIVLCSIVRSTQSATLAGRLFVYGCLGAVVASDQKDIKSAIIENMIGVFVKTAFHSIEKDINFLGLRFLKIFSNQGHNGDAGLEKKSLHEHITPLPQEIEDFICLLQHKDRAEKYNVRPHGLIMHGPPGTGKTLIAKRIAESLNIPFLKVSAADFHQIYFGQSNQMIRQVFEQARLTAKQSSSKQCILFIDEIDALGNRKNPQTLKESITEIITTILQEMDGLDQKYKQEADVIIIGATNDIRGVDDAFLRPGRIDYVVKINFPTQEEQFLILKHYLDKTTISYDPEIIPLILSGLQNATGADIKSVVDKIALGYIKDCPVDCDDASYVYPVIDSAMIVRYLKGAK